MQESLIQIDAARNGNSLRSDEIANPQEGESNYKIDYGDVPFICESPNPLESVPANTSTRQDTPPEDSTSSPTDIRNGEEREEKELEDGGARRIEVQNSEEIIQQIYDGLRLLFQPGQVVELRALNVSTLR